MRWPLPHSPVEPGPQFFLDPLFSLLRGSVLEPWLHTRPILCNQSRSTRFSGFLAAYPPIITLSRRCRAEGSSFLRASLVKNGLFLSDRLRFFSFGSCACARWRSYSLSSFLSSRCSWRVLPFPLARRCRLFALWDNASELSALARFSAMSACFSFN